MVAASEQVFQIRDFRGLNQAVHPSVVDPSQSVRLENAVFSEQGTLKRRDGFRVHKTGVAGNGDPYLGLARFNKGNGQRFTIVVANTGSGYALPYWFDGNTPRVLMIDPFHASYLTCSVTNSSTSVTFDASAPVNFGGDNGPDDSGSWYFSEVDSNGLQTGPIISVDTVTEATETLTLASAWTGATNTALKFKLFRGFTADATWQFFPAGRKLIGCNGTDAPVEILHDGTQLTGYSLGVKVPTTITATAATGGSLTASKRYKYKLVFVTFDGLESSPAPFNDTELYADTDVSNKTIQLEWDVSDPRIEFVDIYRSDPNDDQVTGSTPQGQYSINYYYLTTVDINENMGSSAPLSATYDDDGSVTPSVIAASFDFSLETPMTAASGAEWDGRIFLANTDDYPNGVQFTLDDLGRRFSPDIFYAGGMDRVQGLYVFRLRLLALMTNSFREVIPAAAPPYVSRGLFDGLGVIAPRSVASDGSLLFFMSRRGPAIFDGYNAYPVDRVIKSEVDKVPLASRELAAGAMFDKQWLLAMKRTAVDTDGNNEIAVFDTQANAWAIWLNDYASGSDYLSAVTPRIFATYDGPDDNGELIWSCSETARLMEYSGVYDYDTAGVAHTVKFMCRSGIIVPGDPGLDKDFKYIQVKVETDSAVTIHVAVDGNSDNPSSFSKTVTPTVSGSVWGDLWNFFLEDGTVTVSGTTVTGTVNFETEGVLAGDTFTLDDGVTTHEISVVSGSTLTLLTAPGNGSSLDYWVYRYEEEDGLWWNARSSAVNTITEDLPLSIKGRELQITISEDGSGSVFKLIETLIRYDSMDQLREGDLT